MRKAVLAAAALWLLALPSFAQTAEEIIGKYIKAVGGMQRIDAVKTLRRTGKFTGGGGFEAEVLQENKRPAMVREEFIIQGMSGINAYDGKNGWKIDPFGGKKDPEALGEDEMKCIVEDADFDGALVNYQQKGIKVEYAGTEPVEGTDAYNLKLTMPDGEIRHYYLDTEYYVPIKYEVQRTVRGAQREFEIVFGDYKSVNGWYLPFSIETGRKGSQNRSKVTYGKIEANVALANARFVMPGTKSAESPVAPDASETATAKAAAEPEQPASAGESAPVVPQSNKPVTVDSETISGLGARNIGSSAMSGRVAAVDAVHEGNRLTVDVGASSGGVWKSVNGGTTYKPVFDKQPVQSIGAIAIDPKNPKVVWVGSGEAWTRNSVSMGDGVYKSTDGGDNWTNMGLKDSERIARILIDPTDTNTVFVCVPGKLWSDSDDRGVYKTTDGGKSWSTVLKGSNASTGPSMMSMDKSNPKTLYAGLWDFRRKGWTFRSGGDGPTL